MANHPPLPLDACLVKPVLPSIVWGGVFVGIDAARGIRPSPQSAGRAVAFLYAYHSLQCPMEALTGRRSLVHNVYSGMICGYIGVKHRFIGIPFVNHLFFLRYPKISPPLAGAAVYGALAGAIGGLTGKAF